MGRNPQLDEEDLEDQVASSALQNPDEVDPTLEDPQGAASDADLARSGTPLDDKDLLAKYFSDVKTAKDDRDRKQLFAGLGEAADTVAHGVSGSRAPVDTAFYQNMSNRAEQDVKDVQNNRSIVTSYLRNKALGDKAALDRSARDAYQAKILDQRDKALQNQKDALKARENDKQKLQDQITHRMNLRTVKANPMLRQRLTQYQNLQNALATITQAKNLTPQQVSEFQQAVRSNLGIKSGSGVGEREETYMKTMGMNAANMRQFITGDPAELSKNSKLMQHLKDLAGVEMKNIRGQYSKSLKGLLAGHASVYDRNPELKADIDDFIQSQNDQAQEPSGMGGGTAPAGGGGWGSDQERRYQELKAKQAAGQLR